jgi:hypothetical protein
MSDYEVECVSVDYDSPYDDCRAIEAVGFESVEGGITRMDPAEVHRMIADSEDEVHVVYHGERTTVLPVTDGERRYVRAADEDTSEDPLMKQPSC